jgi:hypothetical protein
MPTGKYIKKVEMEATIGVCELERKCHNCERDVVLQVDLMPNPDEDTDKECTMCLSYECKSCGAEQVQFGKFVGFENPPTKDYTLVGKV